MLFVQESLSATQEVIRGLSYQQMSDHVDELAVEMKSNTNAYVVTLPTTAIPPSIIHPAPSAATTTVHPLPTIPESSAVISSSSAIKNHETTAPNPSVSVARTINNIKQIPEVAVVNVIKAPLLPVVNSQLVPPPITSNNSSNSVKPVAVAVAASTIPINNHLPPKAVTVDSPLVPSSTATHEATSSQPPKVLSHRERERVRGREGRVDTRYEGRGEGRVEGRGHGRGTGRGEFSDENSAYGKTQFRSEGRGDGRGYGRGEGRGRVDGRGHPPGQSSGRGDALAVNRAGPSPSTPHRPNAVAHIQNPSTSVDIASTASASKTPLVSEKLGERPLYNGREGGHEGRGYASGGRESNRGRGGPQQSQPIKTHTAAPPLAAATSTAQPEAAGSTDSKNAAAVLADKGRNGFPAAKAGRGYGGQSSGHHLPINPTNAPPSQTAQSVTNVQNSPQKSFSSTNVSNAALGVNSQANTSRPFNQDRSNGFSQGQGHRQGQPNAPESAKPNQNSVNRSLFNPQHNGSSSNGGRGYPNQGAGAVSHHNGGGGGGGRSSAGRGRGQGPGPTPNPVNPLGNPRAPYGGVPAPRSGAHLMAAQSSPTSNSSGMS